MKWLPMDSPASGTDSTDGEPLLVFVCQRDPVDWQLRPVWFGKKPRTRVRSSGSRLPARIRAFRSVLVGKLAEMLREQRPSCKIAAMFIDMALAFRSN
jgi:hypothetical protein